MNFLGNIMDATSYIQPHIIHWDYFSKYHINCDNVGWRGATYALVFNKEKPLPYQQPYEFEQCVYIGKSADQYYDQQSKHRGTVRGNLHKRMTKHHGALVSGKTGNISSYKSIIEVYGFGKEVVDGTLTGLPMWLCLMIPRPDLDSESVDRWTQLQEQLQLFLYQQKFNRTTLGNMDTKPKRDQNSYSNYRMQSIQETTLERFL